MYLWLDREVRYPLMMVEVVAGLSPIVDGVIESDPFDMSAHADAAAAA